MGKKKLVWLSVFLLLINIVWLISGCTHKETNIPSTTLAVQVTEGRKAPAVSQVNPADMATDVSINTVIEAVFTITMDSSTFTTDSFTLQQGTIQIPGSVTCTGTRAVFKPSQALLYSSEYTATINTGVKDPEGMPVAKDLVWTFSTISFLETVTPTPSPAPEVVSVSPVNQAAGVLLNTTIEVFFSREMAPSTLTTKTFILQQGIKQIPGSVTYTGTKAVFKPYEALSYSSEYTATIKIGVKDKDGVAIIQDRVWTFTTLKYPEAVTPMLTPVPEVVSISPVNNATGVPLNAAIEVVFSKEMDPLAFTTKTFYLQKGTIIIPSSVTCSGSRVVLKPTDALLYQSVYTAVITTEVKDLQGKPINEDYKWSFSTVAAPISGGSSAGTVIDSPTPPISPTPSPTIKQVTIYDNDLPSPPISGMTFHFVTPDAGDPGPGKIQISIGYYFSIWFGVDNDKLWVFNLPKRESLPSSLAGLYDSLGIDQYTTYTEKDGKYWFDEIPPWINISKYDPTLTAMPVLISASSTSGKAQITYKGN
jgi:hypothetical protein